VRPGQKVVCSRTGMEEKTQMLQEFLRELPARQSRRNNRKVEDAGTFTDADEEREALSPTTLFFLSR